MKLYNYWRSGTSYRVRIALELKGLPYEYMPVDLRTGEHRNSGFTSMNPQGLVPALELDNCQVIVQSPAIIEFLEEKFPEVSLLPETPDMRAQSRALASMIGCDIHPLNNLRVLKYLGSPLQHSSNEIDAWTGHWIMEGFSALETLMTHTERNTEFSVMDTPGLVECYLLPQIYSARRFNVDLSSFPRIRELEGKCLELESFKRAHPKNQPDAD